jgi:HEAT repeat protein
VALGRIGDIRAVDPLNDALEDEDEYVREAAMEALEKIQSE